MLIALALVAACGPKNPPPTTPPPDPPGGGGASAGTGATDPPADQPKPLSRAECELMIDHVLELGMAQQRAQKKPEHVPTEAQVAVIRERLVADQLSACLAWGRPQYACVMASTTVEGLYACAEGTEGASDAP